MKTYLQALYQSFGNAAFYAQVIHRWTGAGFRYLLVLALLFSLLLAGHFSLLAMRFYTDELPYFLQQVPELEIKNGVIVTKMTQPHIVRGHDNTVLATIDTTRPPAELAKAEGYIIVGKDFLLAREDGGGLRRVELKQLGDGTMTINQSTVRSIAASIRYMIFLFTPFLMIIQWLMLVTMTVLAACLSYFVTAYMREEFSFETRLRMGAIALTPPLIVNELIKSCTNYHLGFWVILSLCVLHLYLMIIATRHYLLRQAAATTD